MTVWENLNLSVKLKIKSYFKNESKEVWTSSNIQSKLSILWFLVLHHSSDIALQSIFFNSIPHNDTCIKASKVSNFNEAHKWLLIEFCFENPLSQIAKVSWDVANWYITYWCPHQIATPHTMILFSHSCVKVSTNWSNSSISGSITIFINLGLFGILRQLQI